MTREYGAPLGTHELPLLFTRVYRALDARRGQIDALNVFPVPDADTGTNMVLTIKAGLDALRDARRQQIRDPAELARVVIRGVIRGARGNSGVILSQVLRAVVDEATSHDQVDAVAYANALASAQELAYSAVVEPVSGTMLSVIAAAANQARAAVDAGASLACVSRQTCEATRQAVEHTPAQLQVLRDANVVDAGGRGFEVLITAVHAFLTGEQLDVAVDVGAQLPDMVASGCHASEKYPYEVQYLLDADNVSVAPLRHALSQHGDSVVVVAAGNLINVHVHTADVGKVIDVGVAFAPPQNVAITDLRAQIQEAHNPNGTLTEMANIRVQFVGLVAEPAVAGLIGTTNAVQILPDDSSLDDVTSAISPSTALILIAADTPAGAQTAVHFAQQLGQERRADALIACDSPLALLAAISVMDPTGAPDTVLADIHEVLDTLKVTTVTPHPEGVTVADTTGAITYVHDLSVAVRAQLQNRHVQMVTIMFGDLSTLQQRSDVTRVISDWCPDAEQVVLDLPGANVIAWVGVE
ncbi:MAG: DAK2 domain-containing protein [Nitriliruptoraceae bacterium]